MLKPLKHVEAIDPGPVGSGKSTLVLGLLGELSGQGEVSVKGSKALCGQEYLGVKGLKEDWPYMDPR